MVEKLQTTVDLLSKIKAGDQQARDNLYQRYYDRVLAVVRMRLGVRLRAKLESIDVVQDAFLRSLRTLEKFEYRSEGALMHWLTQNVERTIRDDADYFAAQRRDMNREVPITSAGPSMDSVFGPIAELATFTTPSQDVAKLEDISRLECALDKLPPDRREALLLVRYEGMSLAEAGQTMQRSPDAVRMLVARAIVELGKAFGAA